MAPNSNLIIVRHSQAEHVSTTSLPPTTTTQSLIFFNKPCSTCSSLALQFSQNVDLDYSSKYLSESIPISHHQPAIL